jgi:hypothetical protein
MATSSVTDDLMDSDLLADTPEGIEATCDDDSASDCIVTKQQPDMLELDDLLAESVAIQNRAKEHKKALRALRSSKFNPLEEEAERALRAKILEWETLRVWQTNAVLSMFEVQTCKKCLRQTRVYKGEFLEQEHVKMRCTRLVKLPENGVLLEHADMMRVALEQLPHAQLERSVEVEKCAECCAALPKYISKIVL